MAVLVLLCSFLIRRWWQRNRDSQPLGLSARELVEPPGDLPPALAAKLIGSAASQALLGTLFDLANRGYLTFHETMGGRHNKTRQLSVTRSARSPADLTPWEAATLDAVFGMKTEVTLSDQTPALRTASVRLGRASPRRR